MTEPLLRSVMKNGYGHMKRLHPESPAPRYPRTTLSEKKLLFGLVAVVTLAVGMTACAGSGEKESTASYQSAETVPPSSSTTADSAADESCDAAAADALERLIEGWRPVGSASPGASTTTFIASTWVFQYVTAMSALSDAGCAVPPAGLADLDLAVSDLQTAMDQGWGLYGAVPRVAQELRNASAAMGLDLSAGPATCRDLTADVAASFVLLDEGSEPGQSLYPRITVRNGSDHPVIVDFDGEGRATADFVDDMT